MLEKATIRITSDDLLGAIWYSDGSGNRGFSVGIDGTYHGWTVTSAKAIKGDVILNLSLDHGMKEDE
jgi:hypothetical protein